MSYYYYQTKGGEESWKIIIEDKLDTIEDAMFKTVLSVSTMVSDGLSKEEIAAIKYSGPMYFDLDDSLSPGSTAKHAVELVSKLEELDVRIKDIEIYASGGKGFHILVPWECFLSKPPKTGLPLLPYIYKEMAFQLAVESMDFRVYTARKGRMFRQPNVQRENGLYKVRISFDELQEIAFEDNSDELYHKICSVPRKFVGNDSRPEIASGMMALFDQSKTKVQKSNNKRKKASKVELPTELPSFDMILDNVGIKPGTGFHQLAMQIGITAHERGMKLEDLLEKAKPLCEGHESDGSRYNTFAKRQEELSRMFHYTDDNPCYEYSANAICSLLSHQAADLHGITLTREEVETNMAAESSEEVSNEEEDKDYSGVVMSRKGVYALTEGGPRKITGIGYDNVQILRSIESGTNLMVEADIYQEGKFKGRQVIENDTWHSSSTLNKQLSAYGSAFLGSDNQARGIFLRLNERASKANKIMFVTDREGIDWVKVPGSSEPDPKKAGFFIWADNRTVVMPEDNPNTDGISMVFKGYPDPDGYFKTDLGDAPNLAEWLKEEDNHQEMINFLEDLLNCQVPSTIAAMVGWSTACHYRMLFHMIYNQFPSFHINGAAGQGKCLAKDTPILMADGTTKMVQDVVTGDKLLGPDGGIRNVLSTTTGREKMYRVNPHEGYSYTVNESHILSLRRYRQGVIRLYSGINIPESQEILNISILEYLDNPTLKLHFGGWTPNHVSLFHIKGQEDVDIQYVYDLGLKFNSGRIPEYIKRGDVLTRAGFMNGLNSKIITTTVSGYELKFEVNVEKYGSDTIKDVIFLIRSLGYYAFEQAPGHVWVYAEKGEGLTSWKYPSNNNKNPLQVEPLEVGDYYGFEIDGDRLFMLGDFTVTHNTSIITLFLNQHYYKADPQITSPSSSLFSIQQGIAGSSSIPIVVDEFKPQDMSQFNYDRFRAMFRDAYNCRDVARGGGNRNNSDYRSLHKTKLAAPICFISEAMEDEPALMERVLLLTLVKPDIHTTRRYRNLYERARNKRHLLGILGKYIATSIVRKYSLEKFEEEFDPILQHARNTMMLQEGEDDLPLEELAKKVNMKDRTVFNYAVARFGLMKFFELINQFTEGRFDALYKEMNITVTGSAASVQVQTVPEWLKVLNTISDMALTSGDLQIHSMICGQDYAFTDYNGKVCFEFNASVTYFKYRAFCGIARQKPLFPSPAAFVHAINNCPMLETNAQSIGVKGSGYNHFLDLDGLRLAGFVTPPN